MDAVEKLNPEKKTGRIITTISLYQRDLDLIREVLPNVPVSKAVRVGLRLAAEYVEQGKKLPIV